MTTHTQKVSEAELLKELELCVIALERAAADDDRRISFRQADHRRAQSAYALIKKAKAQGTP